jgi:ABC-2 type transport system permease protein
MIHALLGLTRHQFVTQERYWLNLVSGTLWAYLLFVLVFLGIRSPGLDLGITTGSLIIAYWVIFLTNDAFQSVQYQLSNEASVGTLEQLYLSPFPFWWIAFGKMFGGFLLNMAINLPFLFLMMFTTGRWLSFDVASVLPLVTATIAQAYGIGLALGGAALIYKQIGSLGLVPELLMVAFIMAPQDLSPLVRFLPFNLEWRLLRDVMADGIPIWGLPVPGLGLIVLKTIILIGAGWAVYSWCERVAKRKALLGQY